jgi:hypothetical protein
MQPMKFVAPQANEQMGRDPIFSLPNNRGQILYGVYFELGINHGNACSIAIF